MKSLWELAGLRPPTWTTPLDAEPEFQHIISQGLGVPMTTALVVRDAWLHTLYDAQLLCCVCGEVPWTHPAQSCRALICEGCTAGDVVDEDERPIATNDDYRTWARGEYASNDIQIDADAEVAHAEHGAWVQAWVFVYNRFAEEE